MYIVANKHSHHCATRMTEFGDVERSLQPGGASPAAASSRSAAAIAGSPSSRPCTARTSMFGTSTHEL
eukprot:7788676-Pyramimonas_sp.AAC.2